VLKQYLKLGLAVVCVVSHEIQLAHFMGDIDCCIGQILGTLIIWIQVNDKSDLSLA
jgi:hypothetical protein